MRDDDFAKLDRNFIENPLFLQASDIKAEEGPYCWESHTGYRYECDDGKLLPTAVDYKILMHILAMAQHENERRVEFHGSEILRSCHMQEGGREYSRLENSLLRWQAVKLHFDKDVCPLKGAPEVTDIRILEDGGQLSGSKQYYATLSEDWFRINCCSKWWEKIPLAVVGYLRNDLTMRLHALVSRRLAGRQQWSIDALDLARLIPLRPEESYACRVAKRIPEALKSIMAACDALPEIGFRVGLEIRKFGRGKIGLEFFRKTPFLTVTADKAKAKIMAEKGFHHAEAAALLDCLDEPLQKNDVFRGFVVELLKKHADHPNRLEMLKHFLLEQPKHWRGKGSLDNYLSASACADAEVKMWEKLHKVERKKTRMITAAERELLWERLMKMDPGNRYTVLKRLFDRGELVSVIQTDSYTPAMEKNKSMLLPKLKRTDLAGF